jgi:hypothetical protein
MTPYIAVQALGVALPALVATLAPGTIRATWLLAALLAFVLARLLASHDTALLDAIGISGHSLKHVAAAGAAALALHAISAHPGAANNDPTHEPRTNARNSAE